MTKTTEQLHVLSIEECAEIGKRADVATLGPHTAMWVPSGMPTECCKYGVVRPDGIEVARIWERTDVEFYAHARTDIPNLLHTVESLREQLVEAQAVISNIRKQAEKYKERGWLLSSDLTVLQCDHPLAALKRHDREKDERIAGFLEEIEAMSNTLSTYGNDGKLCKQGCNCDRCAAREIAARALLAGKVEAKRERLSGYERAEKSVFGQVGNGGE